VGGLLSRARAKSQRKMDEHLPISPAPGSHLLWEHPPDARESLLRPFLVYSCRMHPYSPASFKMARLKILIGLLLLAAWLASTFSLRAAAPTASATSGAAARSEN